MKSKKMHKKRTAIFYAVLTYLACISMLYGLLHAARTTRQVLYGGKPVMASVTQTDVNSPYSIALGGGEWTFLLDFSWIQNISQSAWILPPCEFKWLWRIFSVAAHQITGLTA